MLISSSRTLDNLFRFIRRYDVVGNRIHDANIVAAMYREGISDLAPYNRQDFKQFDEVTLLSPPG